MSRSRVQTFTAIVCATAALCVVNLYADDPRDDEMAARKESAAHLRVLWMSAQFMAQDAKNQFPATLSDIYRDEPNDGFKFFLSPRTETKTPGKAVADDSKQATAWIEKNADFEWLGSKRKLTDPPKSLLAYEKFEKVRDQAGVNMLTVDGKVRFVLIDEAKKLIDKARTAASATQPVT